MTPFTLTTVANKIRTATTAKEVQNNIRLLSELGRTVADIPFSWFPQFYVYCFNTKKEYERAIA